MKKASFILLFFISFCGCSDNEKLNDFYTVILPVESVILPEVFTIGEIYRVHYTYFRPTACHIFNDLYYFEEDNEVTIAVINNVFDNSGNGNNCEEPLEIDDNIASRSFDFKANNNSGSVYTFRFWQGVNEENGEDIYLTIDVPVIQ